MYQQHGALPRDGSFDKLRPVEGDVDSGRSVEGKEKRFPEEAKKELHCWSKWKKKRDRKKKDTEIVYYFAITNSKICRRS